MHFFTTAAVAVLAFSSTVFGAAIQARAYHDVEKRSQAWIERLDEFRNNNHDLLTFSQTNTLDMAIDVLRNGADSPTVHALKDDAINAFGFEEAKGIFTNEFMGRHDALKGKLTKQSTTQACGCSSTDDWCGERWKCVKSSMKGQCSTHEDGECGLFSAGVCDGVCVPVSRP